MYCQKLTLPISYMYREKSDFYLSRAYFLFHRPSLVNPLPKLCVMFRMRGDLEIFENTGLGRKPFKLV